MLKLTSCFTAKDILVSPKYIAALMKDHEGDTVVYMVFGQTFTVKEPPEEIMAMPEMAYEMYPAFQINTDGSYSKVR